MRPLLKYITTNRKGRLPPEIPESKWLADPSHRTKVVAKPVYLLASLATGVSTCTKVDDIIFKKYYGYMIKTNRMKNISEIMLVLNAVVEHLFDNYEYCDERWCKPKRKQNGKEEKDLNQSFYRSKIKDTKLYNQIWNTYKPFTTETRLKDSLHMFDTQQNEAMNISIAKYAPKTKTYGITISLTKRVMIVIGISNLGADFF